MPQSGPPQHSGLPDWNDLRDLLAVAEAGSLSAAARQLGVSQSTMSRRIAAIEAGGRPVFRRGEGGALAPTERGAALLEAARSMEKAFRRAAAAEAANDHPLRIASCEVTAELFLADAIPLWSARTGQAVDHAVHEDLFRLPRAEYDLLVSPFDRPPEGMHGTAIGVLRCALYAAPGYLERRPYDPRAGLAGHRVIRASGSLARVAGFRWLAGQGGEVALLSSSPVAMLAAAARGQGVALLPVEFGKRAPGLQALPAPEPEATTVWLLADRADASHPRIAAFLRWARAHFRRVSAST